MSRYFIALFLCFASFASAWGEEPACQTRPDVVAACFKAVGTLRLYNGTPSARIILKGAKRILGVKPYITADNETFIAPQAVQKSVSFEHDVSGIFFVCPLTAPKPGVMQSVCIESAHTK